MGGKKSFQIVNAPKWQGSPILADSSREANGRSLSEIGTMSHVKPKN
jgi:hypothetical protein